MHLPQNVKRYSPNRIFSNLLTMSMGLFIVTMIIDRHIPLVRIPISTSKYPALDTMNMMAVIILTCSI
jgi:hypothetical protein